MAVPIRRLLVALSVCCALLVGGTACSSSGKSAAQDTAAQDTVAAAVAAGDPSPTPTVERQRLAKTRFVANAGLAAGATYQWIVKPWKAGKFKKGTKGRTFALVKAGLAGTFAYNRLKAASRNAQGDPLLSKAMAPLTSGIDALKDLPSKLRKGDDSAAGSFDDIIGKVKDAGKSAGAEVKDKVPSAGQLAGG
ncbi:hypothetical protein [Streptomyces acidiscabies]|uniref:Lipoprotein n=1 Tax=Streptomyces acidiscabies TaxID=42234 RepID=A0AAP6B6R6_9ACTN|nr:hypothetical protein [Streptomyces acidiscabies]MBP5939921.1 hypothetical protein [Streptomyces sp. LBUM 1476]MBZ3911110.1 hypothetical protein [Streptomyces acidiscabies]MDX2959109.1 hypothetical protein [Streptomyces acidiscabies]MDX3023957.1 hypothetical protein [Streptomyces acidiscabies]MDX3788222.1 hypothetical protein [Streptomyces acidiscabies]